jgi:predicted CxxxxCH...CXXCH cytochrome family protein
VLWCSNASCHSNGSESHRQNGPVTVVVISSGEEGDRLAGSLEVKVPVAGVVLVRSAQGGEQPDRPQQ